MMFFWWDHEIGLGETQSTKEIILLTLSILISIFNVISTDHPKYFANYPCHVNFKFDFSMYRFQNRDFLMKNFWRLSDWMIFNLWLSRFQPILNKIWSDKCYLKSASKKFFRKLVRNINLFALCYLLCIRDMGVGAKSVHFFRNLPSIYFSG